ATVLRIHSGPKITGLREAFTSLPLEVLFSSNTVVPAVTYAISLHDALPILSGIGTMRETVTTPPPAIAGTGISSPSCVSPPSSVAGRAQYWPKIACASIPPATAWKLMVVLSVIGSPGATALGVAATDDVTAT